MTVAEQLSDLWIKFTHLFTPEMLKTFIPQFPEVASSHAHEIDFMIIIVHLLMIVLFIGWGSFFIFTLIRFRKRRILKLIIKV